jgi:hypothetical protein
MEEERLKDQRLPEDSVYKLRQRSNAVEAGTSGKSDRFFSTKNMQEQRLASSQSKSESKSSPKKLSIAPQSSSKKSSLGHPPAIILQHQRSQSTVPQSSSISNAVASMSTSRGSFPTGRFRSWKENRPLRAQDGRWDLEPSAE